ncbi:MAG: patatin-like phospholipase family protein [Bacillota bacterium]
MSNLGLVLSGGGARGAYQAGVIAAIADIASHQGLSDPFNIFTGVSAGSINATILASHTESFLQSAQYLAKLWGQITTDDVFYVDLMTLSRGGFAWITDLSKIKGNKRESPVHSLFSTIPLRSLINQTCQYENISKKIDAGKIRGLSVSALDYENISTKTFFQGADDIRAWSRPMHRSEACEISSEHVMASAAIPLLFPPIKVGNSYFGDGCIRNQSPCSPAIYMGAERFIAIGVRRRQDTWFSYHHPEMGEAPSIARIINVIFHSMMMDGIEQDLQRIAQTNQHVALLHDTSRNKLKAREVGFLWISPSVDCSKLASQKGRKLPNMIRYLLSGAGSLNESSELVSFLLFEPSYCKQLIEIGYTDGIKEKDQIIRLLDPDSHFRSEVA